MNINPRIVNAKNIDEKRYAYAVCECVVLGVEAIELDRTEERGIAIFNCPRCGKQLGLWFSAKNDNCFIN